MQPAETQYKSLLSWISADSHDQASWIVKYLSRKGLSHFLLGYTPLVDNPEDLIGKLSSRLNEAECRETIRAMRGAWRQKEYRERNGKLVNFQISEKSGKQLTRIAADRAVSRTRALRQLIVDAEKNTKKVRSKTLKANKKLRETVKKMAEAKRDAEGVRNRVINGLSELLVQEIILNCRFTASLGSITDDELQEITEEAAQEILTKRIKEIKEKLPIMRLLGSSIKRIDEYLPKSD